MYIILTKKDIHHHKRYKNINELKADLLLVAMENKNKHKKSSFWSKIFKKGKK